MVERAAVNRDVAGSSPASGANFIGCWSFLFAIGHNDFQNGVGLQDSLCAGPSPQHLQLPRAGGGLECAVIK